MRVQQNKLLIVGHCQTLSQHLNVVVELLKDKARTLLRYLEDQALRLLYVERGHEHTRLARTYLDYVVTSTHPPALFVQDYSVFVEDARLSVDYGSRLCQLFQRGPRTHCRLSNYGLAHYGWLGASRRVALILVVRAATCASLG